MTGIIDRLEEGFAVVELDGGMSNIPLDGAPEGLREGLVVRLEGGRIVSVDEEETARRAAALRRRVARLSGRAATHEPPEEKHRKKDGSTCGKPLL